MKSKNNNLSWKTRKVLLLIFGFIIGGFFFNNSVEAAYKIQQGRSQITTNPTDVSITAVSSTSKAFVLINRGTGYQNAHTDENIVMVRGYLLDTDTIRFYRDVTTQSSWISWQVIECTDDEFTAYHGSGNFVTSDGDNSDSIGATVTPADCFAWVTADNDQTDRQDYYESELTAYVDSSTTVRIQRASSTNAAVDYNWVVVEWDTSKILSIQTGEDTVTTHTEGSRLNVTINTIHTDASILLFQYRNDTNGIVYSIAGNIDSSTQISFYKHQNFSSNNYVRWYVINFGADAVAQRNQIDRSSDTTWATEDVTLSPSVTLNNTIVFSSHTTDGSTAGRAYPRPYATNLLTSTTNLRIQRMRSGQEGWIEWQVLQLPGPTIVDLVGFEAVGHSDKVLVKWQTDSEINNAGFNIYRSTEPEDGFVKINAELIPGLGNSAMGKEYEFVDNDVVDGTVYYYKLEDVEYDNTATMHGPVVSHPGIDSDNDGMTDDWENYYSLDKENPSDAALDPDEDTFINLVEFNQMTDPNTADAPEPPENTDGITIIESNDSGMILELTTSSFETEEKEEDGITYEIVKLPYTHGQTTDEGKPQIPEKGVLLGVPFDANITVNAVSEESEEEILSGYNLYPAPRIHTEKDALSTPLQLDVSYEFVKDMDIYLQDDFYTGQLAEIQPIGDLRGQEVAKLAIYPVQFNPLKGELKLCKKIRIEIDFGKEAEKDSAQGEPEPEAFSPLYEGLLTNYAKAKEWKRCPLKEIIEDEDYVPPSFYKVAIEEAGIYRITWQDLVDAGIDPAALNPEQIKMFHKKKQIAIYVAGEEDGQFDANDYIEFYGKAIDSRYTATNIYWLVTEGDPGRRMKERPLFAGEGQTPENFVNHVHDEQDELYWMDIPDVGYVDDHWFSFESLWAPSSVGFNIHLSGVDLSDPDTEAILDVALHGISHGFDEFDHHAMIYVNGHLVDDSYWDGNEEHVLHLTFPQSHLMEGDNTITIEAPGDTGADFDQILVNWFDVFYQRELEALANVLEFNNLGEGLYSYQIFGFTEEDIKIFDVTKPKNPKRIVHFDMSEENGFYTVYLNDFFNKEKNKKYLALSSLAVKSPLSIMEDQPSNLRFEGHQADYIIITHEDFYDAVLPLANHRAAQGLNVEVVKVQDVYDEFNGGIFSPKAIKKFLRYAYRKWQKPAPTYVLLVGDGTYDYQDQELFGAQNYVPTYLVHSLDFGETGSDNWFVCFNGKDDLLPDMFIGRLPVYEVEQVETIVNKIINYENAPSEDWNKNITLVADNLEGIFIDINEEVAGDIPGDYIINRIYLDDYASASACRDDIIDAINQGTLMLNYAGHSSVVRWAHENIFDFWDVIFLTNIDRLAFIPMMTCGSGYFVFPSGLFDSLAEEMLYSADGGVVATLAPTGISYPGIQHFLDKGLFESIFVQGNSLIGPATTYGKLKVYENAGVGGKNVIETFVLFGDPALELKK